MKRKIISLIMTMVLCFCMLSTTAFATTEGYTISNALFVSAGTLGISQDMLQWSNVDAPGGYKLEIYTESGTRVYSGTLTNNYTPASEVLTSSGTYYFTVYALDAYGNELSSKTSDKFTYTHTHSLMRVEAKDATCTADGNNEYWYCTECGKYFSDSAATAEISQSDTVISARGHSLTHIETQGATCTETGNNEYWYCSVCEGYFSDAGALGTTSLSEVTIPAKGHSWGAIEYFWSSDRQTCTATRTCQNDSSHIEVAYATITSEVKTAATCTAYGEITYTGSFSVDWATQQIQVGIISATGHTEGEAVIENSVDATCTADGSYDSVVYCSVCGEELSRETITVSATGHNYLEVVTRPTCTEKGYTTYTCSACGDSYTDNETEATGHSYEAVITEATYTAQGYTTYTCTHCGNSYEADYTAVKVINETDGNLSTKTTVQELIAVPDGLKNLYSSVDALVSDLIKRVIAVGTGYTEDNALVYDVVLQYSTDGGTTWITATVDNFPADGITVTLPYPDGTDSSYEFTVLHMFTVDSDRLGITAGDTESPTVTKTEDGLVFTLTGLSPVAVSWKAVTTSTTETDTSSQTDTATESTDTSGTSASSTTSAQTGDNSQMVLWLVLLLLSGVGAAGIAVYNTKRRRSR